MSKWLNGRGVSRKVNQLAAPTPICKTGSHPIEFVSLVSHQLRALDEYARRG